MTPKFGTILVGIDDSEDARRALAWAMALAEPLRAELLAVHAAGLLSHLGGSLEPSQAHMSELRRTFEEIWCAPLVRSGVRHRLLTLEGPPVLAILETAQREAVDVIVVGRRGAGNSTELILGSTSHELVERSHRPVLIVPPPGA